jgi:hypothetical protein
LFIRPACSESLIQGSITIALYRYFVSQLATMDSTMSSISLAEAGRLTGLHKVSILRAIRKGKISADKDEHGEWRLQPAELFRVYPPVPEQRNGNGHEQHYAAPVAAALEAEISALKQMSQLLRDQLDDMRGQRDKWEQAAQMALRQLSAPKSPTRLWWWPIRRIA